MSPRLLRNWLSGERHERLRSNKKKISDEYIWTDAGATHRAGNVCWWICYNRHDCIQTNSHKDLCRDHVQTGQVELNGTAYRGNQVGEETVG